MTTHKYHSHCGCYYISDLEEAIEKALAIHIKPEPKANCLVCDTTTGSCDNCKWLKDCIVCNELWPCDTYITLDITHE